MSAIPPPIIDNPHVDKKGADLDRQRFKMLSDIARDLSGETTFPTSFDTVIRLRKALQDPDIPFAKLAGIIKLEPLVSVRLISLANSAVYGRPDREVRDVQRAIERLGLQLVRTTALTIAMRQLIMARSVVAFRTHADRLWEHSLRAASAAHEVARRMTRLDPEEALLLGLIHDIGAFYMIYRASLYEELVLRPDTTRYLIHRWHESIGHALIIALGLPAEMADAMIDHDQPRPFPEVPKSLRDVVFLANLLAGGAIEWLDVSSETVDAEKDKLAALGELLKDDIDAHHASLRGAFG